MRTTGIALLLCYVGLALGKRYMRCELARKLLQQQYRFERSMLSSWICLLEHESNLETDKVTNNPNGSRNYGLFQINSRFCQEDRRGGVCNVKCEELLEENLVEAAKCAKRIRAEEGFRHWHGWRRSCSKPEDLPNLKVFCGI